MNTVSTVSPEGAVTDELAPIALGPNEGESLWLLGSHASIKASADNTAGRVAVIEHLTPRGLGSPLHVHHREDEWFYVIEGELTVWVGGRVINAPARSFVYGPRDIPHTFTVSSETARYLLVTEPGDFAGFMRTLAEPADEPVVPPPASEPPDVAAFARWPPSTASRSWALRASPPEDSSSVAARRRSARRVRW